MDDDVQSDDEIIKCAKQNIVSLDKAIHEFVSFRKMWGRTNLKERLELNKNNKYIRNLRYNLKPARERKC